MWISIQRAERAQVRCTVTQISFHRLSATKGRISSKPVTFALNDRKLTRYALIRYMPVQIYRQVLLLSTVLHYFASKGIAIPLSIQRYIAILNATIAILQINNTAYRKSIYFILFTSGNKAHGKYRERQTCFISHRVAYCILKLLIALIG